ncbi:MAG: hypothetical protein J6W37_04075, partial [Bacteroidales bacterium]|nr:hypothetical protein [Bacteroidales bacterium]
THTHTHNSLVNNHLRGLNTLRDFSARAEESLFLCSISNAKFTMHNAQCRGNGVAELVVVAELAEATHTTVVSTSSTTAVMSNEAERSETSRQKRKILFN